MSIIKTERSFIYTPTRCYVILTTLFAFRTQQLFFFSIVSVYARKKNEKDFCSAQRSCLYASDLCVYKYIYIYGRKKSACAWLRGDNDNVTILRKEKKEPCTYGH